LRKKKKWGSKKLLNEFLSKAWFKNCLDSLLRQIDATGIADRKVGSRRQRECQSVSITKVEEITCSQEHAPDHKSPQEIEQITGIS